MKRSKDSSGGLTKEGINLRRNAGTGDLNAQFKLAQNLATGSNGFTQSSADAYSLVMMAARSGHTEAQIKHAEVLQLLPGKPIPAYETYDSWKSKQPPFSTKKEEKQAARAHFGAKAIDNFRTINQIRGLESSSNRDQQTQKLKQDITACLATSSPFTPFGTAASALMDLSSSSPWSSRSGSSAFDPPSGNPAFSKRS